uniref:MFS family transporter n=1 Tax=Pseudomonas syringae TaxID=317 RepID=I6QY68_PSESX|nr:MFS family transporter [Pseudomonas syringae]
MSKPYSLHLLISAFGIEIFCTQVLFIYTPLHFIFNGGDSVIGSFLRALAYIGPVLFGYYIGVLVDRFEKRRLGYIISVVLGATAACYSIRLPDQTLAETFLFLGAVSVGTYFLNNLRSSVLPSVALASQLPRMNAMLLVTENVALIVAPLIASLLLSLSSPRMGFLGIAALFCSSSLLYALALPRRPTQPGQTQRKTGSFAQNLGTLTSNKPLLHLVFVVMGNNAFTGVYLLYVIINAVETGLFDTRNAPNILVSFAVGAIISGLTAEKAIAFFGNRNLALLCCAFMAISGALPLIAPSHAAFFTSAFLVGFFESYVVIAAWTLRQTVVPAEVLGRVTGITSALFKVSMVVAIPIAGLLGEHLNSKMAILFGICAALLGTAPMALRMVRDHSGANRVDTPSPD